MALSHSYMTDALAARLQAKRQYEAGKELYAQGKFAASKPFFEAANGYADSNDRLADVKKYLSPDEKADIGGVAAQSSAATAAALSSENTATAVNRPTGAKSMPVLLAQSALLFRRKQQWGEKQYAAVLVEVGQLTRFPAQAQVASFIEKLKQAKKSLESAGNSEQAQKKLAEVSREIAIYESNGYVAPLLLNLAYVKASKLVYAAKLSGDSTVTNETERYTQALVYREFYQQAVTIFGDVSSFPGAMTPAAVDFQYQQARLALGLSVMSSDAKAESVTVRDVVAPVVREEGAVAGAEPIEGIVPVPALSGAVKDIFPERDADSDDEGIRFGASKQLLKFMRKVSSNSHDSSSDAHASPKNGK